MIDEMRDFWEASGSWSARTFGPPNLRGPVGPLKHLEKEVKEALKEAKAATDLEAGWSMAKLHEEIIDCLFLTMDAARRAGMEYDEFIALAWKKLAKNRKRKWPDWRTAPPDTPIEHDRTLDDVGLKMARDLENLAKHSGN